MPVAIELHGDAAFGRHREDTRPVALYAPARVEHASPRVAEDGNRRGADGSQHALGLILRPPQLGVRRRDHELEVPSFVLG